jgi:large subunit ribosomal protein L13
MTSKNTQSEKYFLFDCEKFALGRMATRIATLLQGKNTPQYSANKTGNCTVIVLNSDKLNVTGKKLQDKKYHSFSGYPGGISSRNLEELIKKDSRKAVQEAVFGMLPKNKLRGQMMKKMLVFKDEKYDLPNIRATEIEL